MRSEFPLLKNNPDLIYLDNAATSHKPQRVLDALTEFYTTYNSNIHRGLYPLSVTASLKVDEARKTIASFLNTTDDHIIFNKNTTESMNLLSRAIPIEKNHNIVITEIEHHSNFVPWQEMAKRHDAKLRIAKYNKEKHNIQDISELVDENTRIVSFTAMSNVSGQIFNVKKIINSIREKNKDTIIIVDACQWAVHEPIDVESFDADFLACSAHKMYGPLGIGILYAKEIDNLDPFLFGGDMIESVNLELSTYAKGSRRFEAGTLDIAGIVATAEAIEYIQENRYEFTKIEKELTELAIEELNKIEDINIIGHKGEKAGAIISFYHIKIPALDIAHFASEHNICLRIGQHCAEPFLKALEVHATIRMSIAPYNTKEDILKAIKVIKESIELISRSIK